MSSQTYVNAAPIPMTIGDFGNPIVVQLGDSCFEPTDYSSYGSLVVTATLTSRTNPTALLPPIVCQAVDASIGQFLFPGFPKGALAYNDATGAGIPPGQYAISFTVDYTGDASTRVAGVEGMIAVSVYSARPSL